MHIWGWFVNKSSRWCCHCAEEAGREAASGANTTFMFVSCTTTWKVVITPSVYFSSAALSFVHLRRGWNGSCRNNSAARFSKTSSPVCFIKHSAVIDAAALPTCLGRAHFCAIAPTLFLNCFFFFKQESQMRIKTSWWSSFWYHQPRGFEVTFRFKPQANTLPQPR